MKPKYQALILILILVLYTPSGETDWSNQLVGTYHGYYGITIGDGWGNYPNPFNPTTTINFALPEKSHVALKVYDVSGKLIKTLAHEAMEAGYHSILWNGTDEAGQDVASGLYFYKIESENFSQTQKCLLLK